MDNPLPLEALQFAHAAYLTCGYCCVAGSAPLAQVLVNLKDSMKGQQMSKGLSSVCSHIGSKDIDVFVPAFPNRLDIDRRLCRLSRGPDRFDERARIVKYYAPHPVDVEGILQTALSKYGISAEEVFELDETYKDWKAYCRIGPFRWVIYKLSKDGIELQKPVQLIICDTFPMDNDTWEEHVIKSFDINVVKCVAKVDEETHLGAIQSSPALLQDISQGEFEFEVQPCRTFIQLLTRMQKYIKRGFKVKSIVFHSDCTKDYEAYISERFWHLHARSLCLNVFSGTVISNNHAIDIVDGTLLKMFDLPSRLWQDHQFCELCSENMRMVHRARHWRTTGLVPVQWLSFQREVWESRKVIRERAGSKIVKWYRAHKNNTNLTEHRTYSTVMLDKLDSEEL